MNWNQVEGEWKQIKGHVKTAWGKLTDNDLTQLDGKKETLMGKIQERYGVARDEAEKQIDDWVSKLDAVKSDVKKDVKKNGN